MNKSLSTLILASMLAFNASAVVDKNFNYHVDRFADIEVLRYEVPEFDRLSLNQKKMIYYLAQAAQNGRDILWDKNGKYNLQIRKLL
ncbi:MAG: dihydrofolate reductase, partial [Muribaculaceae bacterium]|nr:dihydrofolate reductase [Muribaculaceae bacterium]